MSNLTHAGEQLAAAHDVLKYVLGEVPALPARCDRDGLRDRLQRAQASLTVLAGTVHNADDYLMALSRATTRLSKLIASLSQAACGALGQQLAAALEPSLQALQQARQPTIDDLVQQPAVPAQPPPPTAFAVSAGYPASFVAHGTILLPVPRPSTSDTPSAPQFDAATLLSELRNSDSDTLSHFGDVPLEISATPSLVTLRRQPPRPGDIDTRGSAGETAQLHRLAKDCLQGIGALGNLRIVGDNERWTESTAKFEKRLLHKLDALMALGEPGPARIRPLEVTVHHASASRDDFFRSFARTLVLGCSAGEAAAGAATSALLQDDDTVLEAHIEALALASSPALNEALGQALRSTHRPQQLIALLVALDRRSQNGVPLTTCTAEIEVLLHHSDGRVRAAAAGCLAAHPNGAHAAVLLLRLFDSDLEEQVQNKALEGLCLLDLANARRLLRTSLEAELNSPGTLSRASITQRARLLAVAGDESDASRLIALAERYPTTIEALGFHGHAQSLLWLTRALANEAREPVAAALHRITGALVPHDDPYEANLSSTAWHRWLETEMDKLAPGRLRFGNPYQLRHVATELATFDVPASVRKMLALELTVAGAPRIDLNGWCVQQQQRLAALDHHRVGDKSFFDSLPIGSWPAARPRR